MSANMGLYFPFIHFKDENWLKLSAIYFDKMYRIVPSSYRPEDSDTVKALEGFVDFVRPDWADPDFGDSFVQFIDRYHGRLEPIYGIRNVDGWERIKQEYAPPAAGGRSGNDPRLSYVYFEKIKPTLRTRLIDSGLARFDT
jgi:hypothetical protein